MEELIRIIQNEPEGYVCNAFTISECKSRPKTLVEAS
jgi:hypothetical protein